MAGKDLRRTSAELAGGTVGGLLQVVTGHPLDTIKIRLQSGNTAFTGPIDCLQKTLRTEGMRGLYKGVGPPMAMVGILNGFMFGVNGQMKRVVAWGADRNVANLNMSQVILASLMTAPIYCMMLAPTEYVKSVLQYQSSNVEQLYSGPIDVIRKTVRQDGFFGIFRGYQTVVATRFLGAPWYFASYEYIKRFFNERNGPDKKLTSMQLVIAGGTAGCMFWLGNFPVDSIRTRIQTRRTKGKVSPVAIAREMYAEGCIDYVGNGRRASDVA